MEPLDLADAVRQTGKIPYDARPKELYEALISDEGTMYGGLLDQVEELQPALKDYALNRPGLAGSEGARVGDGDTVERAPRCRRGSERPLPAQLAQAFGQGILGPRAQGTVRILGDIGFQQADCTGDVVVVVECQRQIEEVNLVRRSSQLLQPVLLKEAVVTALVQDPELAEVLDPLTRLRGTGL